MNDSDEYARRFRDAAHQMASERAHMWRCLNCGKENLSNRDDCWKCGMKKGVTTPAHTENRSLPDERSSAVRNHGTNSSAEDMNNGTPALKSSPFTLNSDRLEVKTLLSRYWDAYVIARTTVGLGEIIKVIAVVSAILIVFIALLTAGSIGGSAGFITFLLGVIGAAFVGGQFYLLGLILMAQGQILKASLDTAVNSSTFLDNEHRARIMSLK